MLAGSHVVRLLRMIKISRLVCPGICLRTNKRQAAAQWWCYRNSSGDRNSARPTWESAWPNSGSCTGTAPPRTLCPRLSSEQQCASWDFLMVKHSSKNKHLLHLEHLEPHPQIRFTTCELVASVFITCQVRQLLSTLILCGDKTNLRTKKSWCDVS